MKQWTRQFGTASNDWGSAVALGLTNGGLGGNLNAGDYDAFVVKVQQDGTRR